MKFAREADFEEALIKTLKQKGWEDEVLKNPTEKDLINNWKNILFHNNCGIDRLNHVPLTDTEMEQILEQIISLRTPVALNGFINGKSVCIKRDNPDDQLHLGKEVSLKIYDRKEIAAGQSRYQIVQQPKFPTVDPIMNDRRGDVMLLINGMPLIHIELKRSGVPVSQAYHQIEKYSREGVFTGLYSLIQVFVAMEPEEAVYFANPGPDGKFNKSFYFHWADFYNEPINNWKEIARSLLSIPMAHQLIGFYTIADASDGVLKVMRSYQYYAANKISDKVSKINWEDRHLLGGHIWHTTGSGKTMTSFKSAQLIANSKDADKVIFLMDRIELGTQSLREYRAFAEDTDEVQSTEDTRVLINKLTSNSPSDTLIVTSIQKMSNIKEVDGGFNDYELELMQSKRMVIIVDEAHRSTFGEMLVTIKRTFPNAIFFGFTGTPIHDENKKKEHTTANVFGDELHRYSIADGIRDGNVLGFDPYKILTYQDIDLRQQVAFECLHVTSEDEIYQDPKKIKEYNKYLSEMLMATTYDADGKEIRGIESYIPRVQYETSVHQEKVLENIVSNWRRLSLNSKFHAIFATSSIREAIEYYRLFKEKAPQLKVTALFDPNIDNNGRSAFKEGGLIEVIRDYNKNYDRNFDLATHSKFKKDVAARLAHKAPYKFIEQEPEKRIDILIVVDQMLTGFDSKWVNTLYLDKVLQYENLIQAFSRTNRLFGPEKPFGTIRYYRYPHTMAENVKNAMKLYSGEKPFDLFVDKLPKNLMKMNQIFEEISDLFASEKIDDFEKLPEKMAAQGKFGSLFYKLSKALESAQIQGFVFEQLHYDIDGEEIDVLLTETTYLTLVQRYKELAKIPSGMKMDESFPFDIEGYLTEIDTGKIDSEYMNSKFKKYMKELKQEYINEEDLQKSLDELHKTFATLSQDEQKYANIFLHDIQTGDIQIEEGKSIQEYIVEYQVRSQNQDMRKVVDYLGVDEKLLSDMMNTDVIEETLNEYGRFDNLVESADKKKAKEFFDKIEEKNVPIFLINAKISNLLKEYILENGFDIEERKL
ncbi:type I restriction enzyme, R subunit [Granulicatella balaenopterae]|uniref:Type I restriction enzyme endonuclease subunit n=1 Tax=Granulicatella balaenopterae TaxID=137733 RepID=A0A1H9GPT6_9LACT|nr:HsdR family type I site-specific deoxyribonuclease [Granulicatella balaenopterae]SEQ52024.1 type I restriction enzyme, R subunit [Granulicatella balaenopterae]